MENFIKGCIAILVILAISFVIDLGVAWVLWLIYTAVAPQFHLPLVGYWTIFLVTVGLSLLASFFRSASSK